VTAVAAALMMARAPRPGQVRKALEPMLGPQRCAQLQSELIRRTASWAHAGVGGGLYVAHDPPDSGPELRPLIGADAILFPQNGEGIAARLADSVARVLARTDGPLLIVWPDLPRLSPRHAAAALDDLGAGADVVLGPAIDGGLYLLGIRGPSGDLFGLPEQAWRSPDAMTVGFAAAREAGLEIGILRAERSLNRPADVRAAVVDPLLPDVLAEILR
jgi:glycosyltransferase A (GT-A) superfamily protein (DUF2064 family)